MSVSPLQQFGIDEMVIGVTGVGHGIGRAIALRAVEGGAKVFGCSRTEEDLKSLAAESHDFPGEFAYCALDITDDTAPRSFIDYGLQSFGRIDGFVNNVGGNFAKPAVDYTVEELDFLYSLNLKSVYFCCVAAAQAMMSAGIEGSIVNLASKAGLIGAPLRAPYSALKAGVVHLTKSLAAEWADHGIRVNAISPGATETPALHAGMKEGLTDIIWSQILLGKRPAEPDEVALPTLFMLTEAAAMVTGQLLAPDGGGSLGHAPPS